MLASAPELFFPPSIPALGRRAPVPRQLCGSLSIQCAPLDAAAVQLLECQTLPTAGSSRFAVPLVDAGATAGAHVDG